MNSESNNPYQPPQQAETNKTPRSVRSIVADVLLFLTMFPACAIAFVLTCSMVRPLVLHPRPDSRIDPDTYYLPGYVAGLIACVLLVVIVLFVRWMTKRVAAKLARNRN